MSLITTTPYMELKVQNMVCDRCKAVLQRELSEAGLEPVRMELGEIELAKAGPEHLPQIRQILERNGFELVEDESDQLISQVKALLIRGLESEETAGNVSEYLTRNMTRSYGTISKVFSSRVGMTIEKYFIHLKIEKVKEWIQMDSMRFSEIAYALHYSNSSHLARQFKSVTGMSMSEYRDLGRWERRPLDQIVQKNAGTMKER